MKRYVKYLCLIVVLAMMVTMITSCVKSDDKKGDEVVKTEKPTGTTKEEAADPFAEHMNISWIGGKAHEKEIMDNYKLVQKTLEEKFNVTFSFSPCNFYESPDDFELLVAAGSVPDCGWVCLNMSASTMYNRGVTRGIPIEKVKELCPNYWKYMEDYPLMKAWQSRTEDEYYGFFETHKIGKGGFCTALRLDWMENLGIKPKGNVQRLLPDGYQDKNFKEDADIDANKRIYVTDAQYSWDEFLELLHAFTKSDPDQNGLDDTYGLSTCILKFMDGYYSLHVVPVDGMAFRFVREPDNSTAVQKYSKAYKKFLEMHKEIDDMGYLIPEYWNATYEDVWKYFGTGKAGAIGIVTDYASAPSIAPYNALYENPDAKVLFIPPTQGCKALDAHFMGGSDIGFFFVNKKVNDAKFERILRMFDWMSGTDEGYELTNYGIEGKHFEKDNLGNYKMLYPYGDADNIKDEEREAYDGKLPSPEERVYMGQFNSWYIRRHPELDLGTRIGMLHDFEIKKWPEFTGYYTFYGPGSQEKMNATDFMRPENNDAKKEVYEEYVLSVLTGKVDSDTAYEKMMSVLNGMGYQEYLKVINENMVIVDELKKGKTVYPADIIKK
jgi:hypothetical protein